MMTKSSRRTRDSGYAGLARRGEFTAPGGARRKVFLRHDGLQARLRLTQHRHGSQDAFDETRAGLDHLAFTVADREELDAWASRLPVEPSTPTTTGPAGAVTGRSRSCPAAAGHAAPG